MHQLLYNELDTWFIHLLAMYDTLYSTMDIEWLGLGYTFLKIEIDPKIMPPIFTSCNICNKCTRIIHNRTVTLK